MTTTVGSLLPWIDRGFHTLDTDLPLAGGWLEFFVSGTSTHKDTFSSIDLDPVGVNPNPCQLDSTGRRTIYLEPGAYDIFVSDSNLVPLYDLSYEAPGEAAPAPPADLTLNTSGARGVHSGYTILDTDFLITVNEPTIDPALIYLPLAATRTGAITIKNIGPTAVRVVPAGTDTIDVLLTAWDINTSTGSVPLTMFTATLAPDTDLATNWFVMSTDNF